MFGMIWGPTKVYEMLLEIAPTGQTDLLRQKEASGWILTLAGTPAQRWGTLTFGWVSKSSELWSEIQR